MKMKRHSGYAGIHINPKLFYIKDLDDSLRVEERFTTQNGDLYCSVRPILIFGRILGIIPITGLWGNAANIERLQFRWKSTAAVTTIIFSAVLSLNVLFSFLSLFKTFAGTGGGNATEVAFAAREPLFYLTVLLIYIFFLTKSKTLLVLFTTWRKISNALRLQKYDRNLFGNVTWIASAIYISAIFQNVIANLSMCRILQQSRLPNETNVETELTPLENYYWRSHVFLAVHVPYHPSLAVALLISSVISAMAWNYADVVIIVFSRALYFKFKVLVEQTEQRLQPSPENEEFMKLKDITWAEVRRDHLTLCKLLEDFETFLSPLIFLSYTINIFFICLQLHQGLTPAVDQTVIDSVNSVWSFFHLIFRIVSLSLTASKINEYAHKISDSIQKCSSQEYCKEVERLERMLGTGPLGLSGLGCFVITRAFVLVVISVIFTMEIVLLQTSGSSAMSTLHREHPSTSALEKV